MLHILTSRQRWVPLILLFCNFFASLLPAEWLSTASELPHRSHWEQVRSQKGTVCSSSMIFFLPFHTSIPVHCLISLTAIKKWHYFSSLTFFSLPREYPVILALGNLCHLRGKATFPLPAPTPRFSLCQRTVCKCDVPPGLLTTEHHIHL